MDSVYQLIEHRCSGNPLDAEWGDIYPLICERLALVGEDLSPQREKHQILVMSAAVHYLRESFQSEGNFWDGFIADVRIHNRNRLFETMYQWMIRNRVPVQSGPGHRREVVKTLLSLTGVPAHWNREFADFFIWFFRNHRERDAADVWNLYDPSDQMESRSAFFVAAANKLNLVFQFLLDRGVDPESNPTDICDAVSEQLGTQFDPRRLVRRQDSFLRLWRELFDRMTPSQFRRWLRKRPSSWVTTPDAKLEAARKILVADLIEFGSYTCDGDRVEVVPHPKVSLLSLVRDWPIESPWYGIPDFVGLRSSRPFTVFRDSDAYASSRRFVVEGNVGYAALVPLPLGGFLELPGGIKVPGRAGHDCAIPDLWLQQESGRPVVYMDVPRIAFADAERALGTLQVTVELDGGQVAQQVHRLNQHGMFHLVSWRVPLPHPQVGRLGYRVDVAEKCIAERSITLPTAILFSPSGDIVRPTRKSTAFGGRKYTLLLAADAPDPEFDANALTVDWSDTSCGDYRVAQVRWLRGPFKLVAGGRCWEFERGFECNLWARRRVSFDEAPKQAVLELPHTAVHSIHDLDIQVVASGPIEDGQLTIIVFRDNVPLESLSIGPSDLSDPHGRDKHVWSLAQDLLTYLGQSIREPGVYELALTLSGVISSRCRFYVVPQVQFSTPVPPMVERARHRLLIRAVDGSFLQHDGQVVPEIEVAVGYRVHEVPDRSTGVRCYPECFESTITFARPQVAAVIRVQPEVCGIRTLVRRGDMWVKEPRPTTSDLGSLAVYAFGPAGEKIEVRAGNETILRTKLDESGQALVDELGALSSYCVAAITLFSVRLAGLDLPFAVRRHVQHRNLVYEAAVFPNSDFSVSLDITGPAGASVELQLSSGTRVLRLGHLVLDGSAEWVTIGEHLPGVSISDATEWHLVLVLNGQRQLLGRVWNLSLAVGAIGDCSSVPATDLPTLSARKVQEWLQHPSEDRLVISAPTELLRQQCIRAIRAECPSVVVFTPESMGGGVRITEELIYPDESAYLEGIAISDNMTPQQALDLLSRTTLAPMLIQEGHLLSAFELSILRLLHCKAILVADHPLRL